MYTHLQPQGDCVFYSAVIYGMEDRQPALLALSFRVLTVEAPHQLLTRYITEYTHAHNKVTASNYSAAAIRALLLPDVREVPTGNISRRA